MVLRLWATNVRLQPGEISLWLGTVTGLRIQRLPLVSFARSTKDYDDVVEKMITELSGSSSEQIKRVISGRERRNDGADRPASGSISLLVMNREA